MFLGGEYITLLGYLRYTRSMKSPLTTTRIRLQSAMTFIELIVVISIFGIMATIVLSNFKSFANKITIENVAHDVALRIVEAQRSAASGKLSSLVNVPDGYRPRYGIFVDQVNNKMTLFIDAPTGGAIAGNYHYDDTGTCPSTECVSELVFQNGYTISSILGDSTGGTPLVAAYIIYERPSLQAFISGYTNSAGLSGSGTYEYELDIGITAPTGEKATVKVYYAGNVVVQ